MNRTAIAAAAATALLLPLTLATPAQSDTGWNRAPTTVGARGFWCDRARSTCPSVYHSRAGLYRPIVINCRHGVKSRRYLYRGQSSRDPGKCGRTMDAVWVNRGVDLVTCERRGRIFCYPWRESTGWHYLHDWQHVSLRVVRNGACNTVCGDDVR